MYSKDHIRRNNKDIIFYSCEQSKTSLLIAINAIENLLYSNDLSLTEKKQIDALKKIIANIDKIQYSI